MNKTLKKVLIGGAFLGGGIFFIKKILPLLTGSSSSVDTDGSFFQPTNQMEVEKKNKPEFKYNRASFLDGDDETNYNPNTTEGIQSGGNIPIYTVIRSGVRTDGNLIL